MENCIKSLLPGGNEVEILIVDDGSVKDNTAEIADRYEKEYPGICKAIHQENGGHGAAVNAGLKAASGIFFKVVDSDDWVNEQAYRQVLDTLRRFVYGKDTLDMLITNFVYEKQGARHKKVMSYKLALPKDELFSWNDVKVFVAGQYILMHSVIYRTELLRDCKLELPEHTFYVDNIFVYEPLPHVHTMYYLDVNFYRYFIGRSDQSVNEQVMIGRIDQQIRVTKLMLGYYDVTKIQNRKLRHYMVRYLEIMMVICSILAIKSGSEENMEKKKALIERLSSFDESIEAEEAGTLIREIMQEWNSIGHVPFKEKDKLYKQYHALVDKHFERLHINVSNRRLNNFKSSISNVAGQGDKNNTLYREREKLVRAYENMKSDIQTYENNLGFLNASSKKGNSLVTEVSRKIEKLKDELNLIQKKIDVIDESLKQE